jgi:hypothetical protein
MQPPRTIPAVALGARVLVVLRAFCGSPTMGRAHLREEALMTTAGTEAGKPLPSVKLPTLGGEPIDLTAYRGKKLIVFMWASW